MAITDAVEVQIRPFHYASSICFTLHHILLIETFKGTGSQISKTLTEMDKSRPKEVTQHFDFKFFKSRNFLQGKCENYANFCIQNLLHGEYNYPLIKVYQLVAGVLLIPCNVGLVDNQGKCAGLEFANPPVNGKQGPDALTTKKQIILAKSTPITSASGVGVALTARNIKLFCIFERGASEKFHDLPGHLFRPKPTHACQQNFNSFHDSVPLIYIIE